MEVFVCEIIPAHLLFPGNDPTSSCKKKDIQTNLHEHPIKYVQILWNSFFSTYLSMYLSDRCFRLWSNHTTNDVPDVNSTPLAMHLKPPGCSHLFQLGPGSHPKTAPAPYSPGNISRLKEKMGIIFKRCRLGGGYVSLESNCFDPIALTARTLQIKWFRGWCSCSKTYMIFN